jgi:hypothetical protein
MAMYVVFQWSILPEDDARCRELVAQVADHIRDEHPEITSTRLYTQWTGPLPRRAYIWTEEYADFNALDSGELTSACLAAWKPLEAMAQAGTWTTSVWFDGPEDTRMVRD